MRRTICAMLGLGSILFAQLPNGAPAGAIPVQIGINPGAPAGAPGATFTNVGEPAAPQAGLATPCASMGSDVFFAFTATTTTSYVFETCFQTGFASGTIGDTVLQILAPDGLTELGCDDDSCLLKSRVEVALAATDSVLVRVAGFNGATGTFNLTVFELPPPPSNGSPLSPIDVFPGVNPAAPNGQSGVLFTNAGEPLPLDDLGGSVPFPSCLGGGSFLTDGVAQQGVADVWFRFVPDCSGPVTVSTCPPAGFADEGTHEDTVLQVLLVDLVGGGFVEVGCNDEADCGVFGSHSSASFLAAAGLTYLVRVLSFDEFSGGSFYLTVDGAATGSTAASTAAEGTGCGAPVASLTSTLPVVGAPFALTATAAPLSFGFLLFSQASAVSLPLGGGCALQLDPGTIAFLAPIGTDAAGQFVLATTIPNDPGLVCIEIDLQAMVAQGSDLAFTNGLRLRFGV